MRKPISRKKLQGAKWLLALLLLMLIIAQRFPTATKSPETDRQRYHDNTFNVIKVVDGDTFDIDIPDMVSNKPYTRIRLWGVDTPETKRPGYPVMHFGPEASDYATKVLLGQQVMIKLEPNEKTRGYYGRLLAYVMLSDGLIFNEMLLEKGYAYADPRYKHILRDKFKGLGKLARSRKEGLWRDVQSGQYPHWYRE